MKVKLTQAAADIGISRQALYELVERGKIPPMIYQTGRYRGRLTLYFDMDLLQAWNRNWLREKPWRRKVRKPRKAVIIYPTPRRRHDNTTKGTGRGACPA